ncbi:Acylamino-acid-releasing enzyme [Bagarius yarrelli]|uniref:acylaminoacyl-peptidase n=1 Tax=Bagarius yarrelli TaxID=175774 RepID=A0A556U7Q6_BAGYA|nr:Acylamino-acid-releasing enzyme [Bagarius yarrelli]
MLTMEEGMITEVFKSYSRYPVPVSALITTENSNCSDTKTQNFILRTEWRQCDVDRGVRLSFSQHWNLQLKENTLEKCLCLGPCTSTHRELLNSHAPTGERRAVIRDAGGRQFLEVWGCNGLEKSFDLAALNKHGKVYDDEQFACLDWSPCGEKLLYVAEKKKPGSPDNGEGGSLAVFEKEDKNVYVEDWGEGLVGKSAPVLCLANLTTGDVTVCPGVPPHVSPGQASWTGDGNEAIFVGWWHEPFRLGLKFCSNRRSAVFSIDFKGNCGQFMGVYEHLAPHCWSTDSERIFFSSPCENSKLLFCVERRTGRVTPVQDAACMYKVGFVPDGTHTQSVQWSQLGGANTYESFDWESMIISPPPEEENCQYSGINFGALLLKPAASFRAVKFPLVIFIHVNYRGSTGFGQDGIESLLGNIGSQDVKDVQRAVQHVLHNNKTLDPDRVAVMGGSHGGFLACHLIGQYPEFYRACAVRNPVINAATLLGTSDITDWRYSSVGLEYSFTQLPTPQALTTMLEKSPIVHVAQRSIEFKLTTTAMTVCFEECCIVAI